MEGTGKKGSRIAQDRRELRFDRSVELVLFRKDLYDVRPSQVISDHTYAENYVNKPISLDISLEIANEIAQLDHLPPAKIDLGMFGFGMDCGSLLLPGDQRTLLEISYRS